MKTILRTKSKIKNNIGIIIHGPYSENTLSLIKNAISFFGKENLVYITTDNLEFIPKLNCQIVSPNDPGVIDYLGRKGKNILRHINNIKEGCKFFKNKDYIFKIRSDLNLTRLNLLELENSFIKYPNKILRLFSFTRNLPWYHNDYIIGAPYQVMNKFTDLILNDMDKLMSIFIFNKFKYDAFDSFEINPEIIISLSLYMSYFNLDSDEILKRNILTDRNIANNGSGAFIFFKLNNILSILPKRLSILSVWNIKLRIKYYFKVFFIYPFRWILSMLQFYVQ